VASHGSAIVDQVRSKPAAASGTPLYEMEMSFELPRAADVEALRGRLAAIEQSLHIDITLAPA